MRKVKYLIITACFIVLNMLPITMVATTNPLSFPKRIENLVSRKEEEVATYELALIDEVRKKLKACIADARIKYLFNILRYIIQPNASIYNEVCLSSYRFNSLEASIRNGVIGNERATVLANQIVLNLLAIVDKINILDLYPLL